MLPAQRNSTITMNLRPHHLGPPGIECINPLMHMGPVKLDSARFSRKCDISVSTEFPTTLAALVHGDDVTSYRKHFDTTTITTTTTTSNSSEPERKRKEDGRSLQARKPAQWP
ncbi:hypothetical protein M0802_002308 [Mischocyttarus mexicanus]|nr:hypothetical protein M0802_002308 [Mischocyttarus mexicanus]